MYESGCKLFFLLSSWGKEILLHVRDLAIKSLY